MKKSTKSLIEFALMLSLAFVIFLLVVFSTSVLNVLSLAVYSSFLPLNVVFDEGIDLKEYDASVILNCLHGGTCPAGVSRTNDSTGEIEEVGSGSKVSVPVQDFSPESVGFPIDTVSNEILDAVKIADYVVYFLYFLIFVILVVIIVILIKRRKKYPNPV